MVHSIIVPGMVVDIPDVQRGVRMDDVRFEGESPEFKEGIRGLEEPLTDAPMDSRMEP